MCSFFRSDNSIMQQFSIVSFFLVILSPSLTGMKANNFKIQNNTFLFSIFEIRTVPHWGNHLLRKLRLSLHLEPPVCPGTRSVGSCFLSSFRETKTGQRLSWVASIFEFPRRRCDETPQVANFWKIVIAPCVVVRTCSAIGTIKSWVYIRFDSHG